MKWKLIKCLSTFSIRFTKAISHDTFTNDEPWGRCQILTGCNVTKAITSSFPQRCNGVFTLAETATKTETETKTDAFGFYDNVGKCLH